MFRDDAAGPRPPPTITPAPPAPPPPAEPQPDDRPWGDRPPTLEEIRDDLFALSGDLARYLIRTDIDHTYRQMIAIGELVPALIDHARRIDKIIGQAEEDRGSPSP